MSSRSSYTTQTEGYNVGFPSPAADYVERRLTVDSLCGTGPNTRIVQTETGYAVVDCFVKPKQGDTVLIQYGGGTDFTVVGVVTFVINRIGKDDDDYPVI